MKADKVALECITPADEIKAAQYQDALCGSVHKLDCSSHIYVIRFEI